MECCIGGGEVGPKLVGRHIMEKGVRKRRMREGFQTSPPFRQKMEL